MDETYFSARDVYTLLGVSHVTYYNWIARGLITPSEVSTKRGVASKFTKNDVIKCRLFLELTDQGFHNRLASNVAFHEHIDEALNNRKSTATVPLSDAAQIKVNLSAIRKLLP